MKNTFLLYLYLIFLAWIGQAVVILESSTSVFITSPAGAHSVISTFYNYREANLAGKGISWITSSKASNSTQYQSLFYSTCAGGAKLTISAASSFNVYIDGAHIGNGKNYSHAYNFPIYLSCGRHNLSVVVSNTKKVNEGLTFAIDQDQSNCYNCQLTGYWD